LPVKGTDLKRVGDTSKKTSNGPQLRAGVGPHSRATFGGRGLSKKKTMGWGELTHSFYSTGICIKLKPKRGTVRSPDSDTNTSGGTKVRSALMTGVETFLLKFDLLSPSAGERGKMGLGKSKKLKGKDLFLNGVGGGLPGKGVFEPTMIEGKGSNAQWCCWSKGGGGEETIVNGKAYLESGKGTLLWGGRGVL